MANESASKTPPKELTNKEAAAFVKRSVPEIDPKSRKPTGEMVLVDVTADEVLAFKDYGDHVMVVTVDGQKLRGKK